MAEAPQKADGSLAVVSAPKGSLAEGKAASSRSVAEGGKGGKPPSRRPGANSSGLPPVAFSKLYTYSTRCEVWLVVVSVICAAASGAILPLFSIVFGQALNVLNDPLADIVSQINQLALYFFLIAIVAGILTFAELALISYTTEQSLLRLRRAFVEALLRQDAAWHDTHRAGEAVTRLAEATLSVGTGMTKVASVARYIATLVTGLGIGFSTSWQLTLVIMACAPLFAIALAILIVTAISAEKGERTAYARAGDVANEVFSQIRAVAAFGGELHEVGRYNAFLLKAQAAGIRKGLGIGAAVGGMLFTFFAMYGIATFSGATFIIASRNANPLCVPTDSTAVPSSCFTGGSVVTTFVAVLLGALSFGQIGPLLGAIGGARAAAADLYGVIDAVPAVDVFAPKQPDSEASAAIALATGGSTGGLRIEFKNVSFAYPSRPDIKVLTDFSLTIAPGEAIGVCGSSGCGKSTIVLLILRFYDVSEGAVLVNGVDVRAWHLPTLRDLVGLVSQEPVLFGVSVRENISMGKPSSRGPATLEEVIAAATHANAHAFVSALPQGYDTVAGTGVASSQLSGGQRQRLCIARALIKAPRALLCDEATSALDTASERIVQAAIDAAITDGHDAAARRTTLLIAHRLSTLRNADRVIVLAGGKIVEEGAPAELAKRDGGMFASMLHAQEVADPEAAGGDDEAAVSVSAPVLVDVPLGVTVAGAAAAAATPAAAAAAPAAAVASPMSTEPLRARLWAMQRADWPFVILGIFGALVSGAISPLNSLIYSGMITIFYGDDSEVMKQQALTYLGYFFALGFAAYFGVLCRVSVFTYLGERLTSRLRSRSFAALLRQPAAFFDAPENSVGRLSTRLATDAALVKGATGDALGSLVEGFGAIVAALIISFVASWRLALVLLCVFPFLIAGQMAEFTAVARSSQGSNKDLEAASDLVSEAVSATRTVAAYNLQPQTLAAFSAALDEPLRAGLRRGLIGACGQGGQRFVLLCAYSLAFFAGARFISNGELDFSELIRTFLAITLAAEAVGRISSQAPDSAKAKGAAQAIFKLIDSGEASPIDPLSNAGARKGIEGAAPADGGLRIEFRSVSFAYPSRPDVQVLKNFSLTIAPGETIGVVGASGCGKSTLVLLILRFYDVSEGAVLVNGVDVRAWNVVSLRELLGLVSQEPALYADSVDYNIAYGVCGPIKGEAARGVQPLESGDSAAAAAAIDAAAAAEAAAAAAAGGDDAAAAAAAGEGNAAAASAAGKVASGEASVTVAVSEYPPPSAAVVQAAREANAYGFVTALPAGFATYVGARGSLLSGGQRQRVAIARALLRSPRALLLDEATAALDSQSERLVQAALDAVIAASRKGGAGGSGGARTTLLIAHRLSTLANADRVVVVDKGAIVEEGSHAELMARTGGKYREMAIAQGAGARMASTRGV